MPSDLMVSRTASATRNAPASDTLGSTMTNSSPPYRADMPGVFDVASAITSGDRFQALVAGLVPVIVVIAFEIVDIEQQHRQRIAGGEFAAQEGVHGPPVGETREPVGGGELGKAGVERIQLVFHHLALGDVAKNADIFRLVPVAPLRHQLEIAFDPGNALVGAASPESDRASGIGQR